MTHHVKWFDRGREPREPPDPAFPHGRDLDSGERPACKVELPYPTKKRIGLFVIDCDVCNTNAVITTAGRPDDPRTYMMACKVKGSA